MGLFAKALSLRDDRAPPERKRPVEPIAGETARPAAAEPLGPAPDSRPGDGLLRRSEEALGSRPSAPAPPPASPLAPPAPPPAPPPPADMEKRLAALTAEVMDVRAGIEAPAVLFERLAAALQLERAAILVPDALGLYSPWAAAGLDKTTLRRLRMASEEASTLAVSTLEGPELAPRLHLFSSRDSAAVERLSLWPCPGRDRPAAVVVVADLPPAVAGSAFFVEFLPGILQALGQALQERREDRLGPMRSSLARPSAESPERFIDAAIARLEGAEPRASLLTVSLEPVVRGVAAAAPSLDDFRLSEDVATVLARLTLQTAELTMGSSPHELHLLVPGPRELDAELVLHALLAALRDVLPSLPAIEPRELSPRVRRLPDDGTTAAELLAAPA